MMKMQHRVLHLLCVLFVATAVVDSAAGDEPATGQKEVVAAGKVPRSARFDLKGIKDDSYVLAGRLSLKRRFMGTRANPPFIDLLQFHCFNGEELKFSTFEDQGLVKQLSKRLAKGHSLPAIIKVQFRRVRVGHDGINMSERLVGKIGDCQLTDAVAISDAAQLAGYNAANIATFRTLLAPDLEEKGVAITLGKVTARSKVTPRGTPVSIQGIRVFNNTAKMVEVEIVGLQLEQDGFKHQCTIKQRSTPLSWQVKANDWSDGIYEPGRSPRTLWMFNIDKPIQADKQVTFLLEIKLDGGKPLLLKETVKPLS